MEKNGDFFLENFPWLNRVGGSQSRPVQISEPPGPNPQRPPLPPQCFYYSTTLLYPYFTPTLPLLYSCFTPYFVWLNSKNTKGEGGWGFGPGGSEIWTGRL